MLTDAFHSLQFINTCPKCAIKLLPRLYTFTLRHRKIRMSSAEGDSVAPIEQGVGFMGKGHVANKIMDSKDLDFQAIYIFKRTTKSRTLVYDLVLRLCSETKIRLDSAETRKEFLCFLIVDRHVNNDVFLWLRKLATHFRRLWSRTFQSMGVTTECLSPNCKESMTRCTSVELRPVLAG